MASNVWRPNGRLLSCARMRQQLDCTEAAICGDVEFSGLDLTSPPCQGIAGACHRAPAGLATRGPRASGTPPLDFV